MSIKLMSMSFDVQGVTPSQKSVLVALADHARDDGYSCYPSQGRIAHKTSLGKRTVGRALAELDTLGLISKVGTTTLNVVEWRLNIAVLADKSFEYMPERQYPVAAVADTPSQNGNETVSETPVEPTYVPDDGDGTPLEHIMFYHDILALWKENMPRKSQPKTDNRKLQTKVKARMKDTSFVRGIEAAILKAKQNSGLRADSWFQLEYLLRNDDNWRKVANGEFDWKGTIIQVTDPPNVAVVEMRIKKEDWKPTPGSV